MTDKMPNAHTILYAENLNKSFQGFQAIKNLSISLDEGELRTVIGPNGAGKSTFLDLITGRTRPDSGTLIFNGGQDLTLMREYEITRLGIGRKFQTPAVYANHTVRENLLLSLAGSRGVWHMLFGRRSRDEVERIDSILETVKLSHRRDWMAGALSHGQKQWLEIGMLLAQNARILLVDEPAAGMTDEETHRTGELLLSLAGKHTLVVIEHDMTFVRQIAKDRRVTVLHQGSVLCEGSVDHVQSDPRVVEVYLGRKHKAA
jgi:urea transport system ATP-binding protein